ncbi:MAG: peptidoglycan editing factor PgeF [Alphaproteobacteria bacterium]|nr:peptidoglycan editing factor PgeF [Alphaproteobacteria bacterium]
MAIYETDDSLSALSGIRHGFFTRNGGVSEGIYGSLNIGAGSDDAPDAVAENKRRVAEAMGVSPENLLTLYQIHSDIVLTVDSPFVGERPQADGFVTATPGLALGILTADCAPVLFADADAKVIGACHSGWKGAITDIPLRTVEAMEKLGAKRENITAVIGPCISQPSYEVDAKFRENFVQKDAKNARFFIENTQKNGHFFFDLPGYVKHRLEICGIAKTNILAKDTCSNENAFFSYRRKTLRGEKDYGRQVSVIVLEPQKRPPE